MPSGRPWPRASSPGFSAATIWPLPLVDLDTGSCRDGLHPDRANENRGGESVVCYLLGLAEIRQLARVNVRLTKPTALRAVGA